MQYDLTDARDWARENLRGHIVTTTTPFLDDLSLDEDGLRANVEHLIRLECTGGFYVNSVIGEVQALTGAERDLALRTVVDQVGGRLPVIGVVAENVLSEAVAAVERCRVAGADLVMLWPPTFGHRTAEGVLRFVRTIADEAGIGLCVYASGLSEFGFRITTPMLHELAAGVPHLVAVKEASMSLSGYLETLSAVGDALIVSCPLDEYWAAGRTMFPSYGPDVLLGTSRPLYLETEGAPHLSRLRRAVNEKANHESELRTVLTLAADLHTKFLEAGSHNIALIKEMSGLRGLAAGPVRPPMSPPTADAVAAGSAVMREHGLIMTPAGR